MSKTTRLRRGRVIPFGYKVSEHDPKLLIAVPAQMKALRQGLEYCKSCSYREVAKWIEAKCGRKISSTTLHNIIHGKLVTKRVKNRTPKTQNLKKTNYNDPGKRIEAGITASGSSEDEATVRETVAGD